MADRITWNNAEYSAEQGTVGGIHLFAISWRTARTGKEWVLRGSVPGFERALGDYDTTDEAKARAEQILVRFVEKLGARF